MQAYFFGEEGRSQRLRTEHFRQVFGLFNAPEENLAEEFTILYEMLFGQLSDASKNCIDQILFQYPSQLPETAAAFDTVELVYNNGERASCSLFDLAADYNPRLAEVLIDRALSAAATENDIKQIFIHAAERGNLSSIRYLFNQWTSEDKLQKIERWLSEVNTESHCFGRALVKNWLSVQKLRQQNLSYQMPFDESQRAFYIYTENGLLDGVSWILEECSVEDRYRLIIDNNQYAAFCVAAADNFFAAIVLIFYTCEPEYRQDMLVKAFSKAYMAAVENEVNAQDVQFLATLNWLWSKCEHTQRRYLLTGEYSNDASLEDSQSDLSDVSSNDDEDDEDLAGSMLLCYAIEPQVVELLIRWLLQKYREESVDIVLQSNLLNELSPPAQEYLARSFGIEVGQDQQRLGLR